jgi:hypothetical protein
MAAVCSSEMLVCTCKATQHYNLEKPSSAYEISGSHGSGMTAFWDIAAPCVTVEVNLLQ